MPKPNDKIGPYTLISKLGRGAFGVVWLAEKRTPITTTKVAIKIPNDEDIDLEAVKQEASLWVHASGHPNVLPIIDADIHDELVIIVSEYAPDGSLSKWLENHGGKAPSIELAIEMTLGILSGLEHLHERGIIHRDLKPDNILLQRETPRLADFGIARILKTTSKSTVATGTPAYMPPEAFDGKRSEQTDIWSAGVIFYQLLTGSLPFPQTDMPSLLMAIVTKEPEPLPNSIPEPIRRVVEGGLKRNPDERWRSAAEMKRTLRSLIQTGVPPQDEIKTKILPQPFLPATGSSTSSDTAASPTSRTQAGEAATSPLVPVQPPQEQTLPEPTATLPASTLFSQPAQPTQTLPKPIPATTLLQKRKWLWAAGGFVALLLVAVIIYAAVRSSNKSTANPKTANSNGRPTITPAPEKWTRKQALTGPPVSTLAFSPDGKYLAFDGDGLELFDLQTGSVQRRIKYPNITHLNFSPDSKSIVTSSTDPHVKIWDVETGTLKQEIKEGSTTINVAVFSPDGKLVAFDDEQDHISFWNVQTGEQRRTKQDGEATYLNALAFSPDGKLLASCAEYTDVMLWDVQTLALIKELKGHNGELEAVAFSPDGKTLASGGWDKTIKLWDVATGNLKQTLNNGERVGSIAFHPDGKIIAVGGFDNFAVKIWDVQTGTLKQTLEGHSDLVWAVAFSPDGKLLASGGFIKGDSGESVILWQGLSN